MVGREQISKCNYGIKAPSFCDTLNFFSSPPPHVPINPSTIILWKQVVKISYFDAVYFFFFKICLKTCYFLNKSELFFSKYD